MGMPFCRTHVLAFCSFLFRFWILKKFVATVNFHFSLFYNHFQKWRPRTRFISIFRTCSQILIFEENMWVRTLVWSCCVSGQLRSVQSGKPNDPHKTNIMTNLNSNPFCKGVLNTVNHQGVELFHHLASHCGSFQYSSDSRKLYENLIIIAFSDGEMMLIFCLFLST